MANGFPMRTLADMVHDSIHDGDRTKAARVAARMGIPYQTLAKYALSCNGDERGHRLPAELVPPLTIAAESFAVLDYLEAAVGRVAIALPVGAAGTRELAGAVCRTVKEFGDVAREAGAAIADGTVTRKEAERVERESLELVREIMALVAAVKAAVKA